MKQKPIEKTIILAVISGLVVLFFTLGLHKYLTLELIKESQGRFQALYAQHPFWVICSFVTVYIPMIALNLPGATLLGLGAGALFGALTGTVVISFAATIGASLACLLSRYLLRDWVQKKCQKPLKRINEGIQKEGAFYLFSMRLIPIIPFFMINMAMGLTPMRLWTFYWVSQLGMLPGTFIYVNAGSQLARIDSLSGIVSPGLIGSLALLGIFPLVAKKLLETFRKPSKKSTQDPKPDTGSLEETGSPEFVTALEKMQTCTNCGACKSQCAFLKEYGTPADILKNFNLKQASGQAMAFECSLCNLCAAVCPEGLDPGHLFFLTRQKAMADGNVDLSKYKGILSYEQKGSSPLFSWYGLPRGCDTVFFPGCTLPGTRPSTTWKMFGHLQKQVPAIGIVLDCCTKPSHDLGRQDHFDTMFSEMLTYLKQHQIRKVWVACPNCYKIFKSYGQGIEVATVYEVMEQYALPRDAVAQGEITVHDPCPLREENRIQASVRNLLNRMGMTEGKLRHQKNRTLCCGEGGSVGCVRPDLAKTWGQIRKKEVSNRSLVTYCAGCAGFLNRVTPTVHLADLIFDTQKSLNGGPKVARAPFTYLNRIRLKQRLKSSLSPAVQRVRNPDPAPLAQQDRGRCTLKNGKTALARNGRILAGVFTLSIGLFFLVRHFI